jgi:hypothetical protein
LINLLIGFQTLTGLLTAIGCVGCKIGEFNSR